MITRLKKKILSYLSPTPGKYVSVKDLAKVAEVKEKDEYRELRSVVGALQESGIIASDVKGRIAYVPRKRKPEERKGVAANRLIGRLAVNKKGLGTVRFEGNQDEILIPPRFMKTALHGDLVEVVPFARARRQRHQGADEINEGEVVAVVERASTTIVGKLEKSRDFFFVIPDDRRIARDIYLAHDEAARAKPGDKVVVQLLPWEDEQLNPEGTLIEVLGRAGDPHAEVLSVAHQFGLPTAFPPAVEHEAGSFSEKIPASESRSRIDLRKTVCVTIDPEDAKDFDDAVSFEPLPGGNHRLGIHIADVSHYVKEGSALDAEALMRGTSVYMVNEVIPMLPERLSNNLCSLKPRVDRLAFSVLMEVTNDGRVVDYTIGKSVIHSARRFAYEEVQKILETGRGEFSEMLLPLHKFTQVLMRDRRKRGSIDFDTGEAKFKFDKSGLPSEIIKKTRLDAHRLIEECMLLANKMVAEHIGKIRKEEHARPFIYRIHDAPDPSRLEDLGNFVKQFGYALDTKGGVSSLALQRLLDKVKGSEVENVINEVALRSMAKAVYAEKNIGHYGLAFKYYTHFTSPIRRYPDLIVHRLLQEYAQGQSGHRRAEMTKRLPGICRQSSEREQVAAQAERASVKVMQVEYMRRHVGDVLEGVIGGVTNFGFFVEINDLLVEGLVKVRDLSDDYYLFDEKHYSLRGRSRGRIFRLGDKVKVRVVSVNPETREIDFAVVK